MSAKKTKKKGKEEAKSEGPLEFAEMCGEMMSGGMPECCGPQMRGMMSRWMAECGAAKEG